MVDDTESETKQLAIRLPVALVERIERHAVRLEHARPGVNVTRTEALRALLIDALNAAEEQERAKKPA